MKYFALLFLCTFSISAHAALVSITCNGREIVAGDTGKRGSVVIVSEPPSDSYAGQLHVAWSDISTAIIGDGLACGVAIPQGMACALSNGLASSPYHQTQICGLGGIDSTAQPYRSFDATLTLSYAQDHGFFSCRANDFHIGLRLELSGCRPTDSSLAPLPPRR